MKLFNDLCLKFEKPDWSMNPEFAFVDTIFEEHPELYDIVKENVVRGTKESIFGRGDTPTVEQIVRAAIFKEIKGLDYRELEYAQSDSRICSTFIKLDNRHPFSFSLFQQYISKISANNLYRLLVAINQIAIDESFEDIEKVRQDSTVVKSNIHYPTENSLIWDCIKESHRLLCRLQAEVPDIKIRNYKKQAKNYYYRINNTKKSNKKKDLFEKQLKQFTRAINQVDRIINSVKKKEAGSIIAELKSLLDKMRQIYDVTYRQEIKKEEVSAAEKFFSIYEPHTDIIVKGTREVYFGHKVNFAGGKSNLILECQILRGNPSDSTLYQPTINRVIENYNKIPRDSSTDGGYASKANQEFAKQIGIKNIVFNKVRGSLQNICSSKNMETRLKRWRSGMEAVISNFKRGYDMFICNWKGWEHFKSKVLWSCIAYNIRVMTSIMLQRFKLNF